MVERVQTGGTRTFNYSKEYHPKLNDEQKRDISEAYRMADERKARERRNRRIFWIGSVILILLILFGVLLFKSI